MPLPVNEVFETIQGEAYWTGTPSTFVRLQGCDVGCPWCDTKHTWALSEDEVVGGATMLGKTHDGPSYARLEPSEIVGLVATMLPRHVVITGGEPCINDLTDLTAGLMATGRTVQIETSGTQRVRAAPGTWVTVSPKINMPGGFVVLPEAVAMASEIKMPVGKLADVELLRSFLDDYPHGDAIVWLQPLSTSEKATAICVKAATRYGWRLSMQTHKYLGLR